MDHCEASLSPLCIRAGDVVFRSGVLADGGRYAFWVMWLLAFFFFFQAEDGIRDDLVTGVQTCALPIFIEAMAAGVPQVVSDWSGYRDIVVHGETGFRVQTYWASCDDDAIAQWAVWG